MSWLTPVFSIFADIESPEVFMNNKATSNLSVFEDVQTNLKCVFDAHPRPLVV